MLSAIGIPAALPTGPRNVVAPRAVRSSLREPRVPPPAAIRLIADPRRCYRRLLRRHQGSRLSRPPPELRKEKVKTSLMAENSGAIESRT